MKINLTRENIKTISEELEWEHNSDDDLIGNWWITDDSSLDPDESHERYELESGLPYPFPWLLFCENQFYEALTDEFVKRLCLI